ncbi:MAG: hypothetical protein HC814_00275 [Rhodobacteraceae bacterium]|nr:hypothetical protein [Paracoccaceae bacterium]
MPESGQGTLSTQLTTLLTKVLTAWHALGHKAPWLAYITDGGDHPKRYYRQVLQTMADPWRPGRTLAWQWIVDFWHACGYVNDLAKGLFGDGIEGERWFAKWRRWLRDRRQGLADVLRSATWHYNNRKLTKAGKEQFWKGYRYLRKHRPWMHYAAYRSHGLPIGSGVTEAACKTVFAERIKRSGMTWNREGGQVIIDLRVLVLSGVWRQVHHAYLASRPTARVVPPASYQSSHGDVLRIAA